MLIDIAISLETTSPIAAAVTHSASIIQETGGFYILLEDGASSILLE